MVKYIGLFILGVTVALSLGAIRSQELIRLVDDSINSRPIERVNYNNMDGY